MKINKYNYFNDNARDYLNHPFLKQVRELYLKREIKNIKSAIKILKDIKYKVDGDLTKASIKKVEKFENQYNEYKQNKKIKVIEQKEEKEEKEEILKGVEILKTTVTRNTKGKYKTTDNKYKNYKIWLNSNLVHRAMSNNHAIVHKMKFYDASGNELKTFSIEDDEGEYVINTDDFKIIFMNKKSINDVYNTLLYVITFGGSDTLSYVETFLNKYGGRVEIIIEKYNRVGNIDENQRLLQRYASNIDGTCVYDGLLNYFSEKENNKHAMAIYNKLSDNCDKYAKSYNVEELKQLCENFKISINIIDLVDNVDKIINENKFNRFRVPFINTKYNHLDLLKCEASIEEIKKSDYVNIKKDSNFYVEKMGTLYTLSGNFKSKSDFNVIVNEWKKTYNIHRARIDTNGTANNFISKYDDKVHRFFKQVYPDNNLYEELDINKAYYNYHKSKYYNGIPSGSYICVNGDGLTIEDFKTQCKNNLVGWYEVIIIFSNGLEFLGFEVGTSHLLYSSQLLLLIENGLKINFINYCISPAIHAPFDESFLKFVDDDNNLHDKKQHVKNTRAYCKLLGQFMIEEETYTINIKPLDDDKEFYKTLTENNKNIYNIDNEYKIIKGVDSRSLKHITLSIHALSSTIILEQILKINKDDIIGVKVDSIIIKKNSIFEFDKDIFKIKRANIEGMINKNYDLPDELDFGLDIERVEGNHNITKYFECVISNCTFDKSPVLGHHILNNIIMCGGIAGSGKTTNLLTSKTINQKRVIFTSASWDLIQSVALKYPDITGISLPKLTGEMNGQFVEKFNCDSYDYIINDELTLQSRKTIKTIINDNKDKFIFLLGDVDFDGKYYQCSIGDNVIKPLKLKCQYVSYVKSYRFDEELNNKLLSLRQLMKDNKNKNELFNFVKSEFQFKNINDVKFNDDDIGISALKNKYDENNECEYSKLFKDAKPQYYIKNTNFKKGEYKGALLKEKPEHNNYTCSLFRTIHSYQGRELNLGTNKIVILLNSLFDYNLLYTALSRARRCDQIVIINDL